MTTVTPSKTYAHTVAVAIDQFWAAILFNRPDLTISAMCGLVLAGRGAVLKANRVQTFVLRVTGRALNAVFTGHCDQAMAADIERAQATLTDLGAA
jgi:hypothetical protein